MFSRRASRLSGTAIRDPAGPANGAGCLFPFAPSAVASTSSPRMHYPSLAQQVSALRQADHVQNQRHFAVSHDGGPGVDGDVFQVLTERLDHDLFGVVDFVHHQPEVPAIGF